jgi:rfaE bifunctional protein kinase chain/domain/rfaE bifunctional protein nucleotidyltransferase chain/domain
MIKEKFIKNPKLIRKIVINKKIVLCHGVFDVLHIGHLNSFRQARKHGDILVVSVTSDEFVNKGPGRPSFKLDDRINFLKEIGMVDFIVVSNNLTAVNIIKSIKPNVYCKGMDYKDQINFDKNLNLEINALKSFDGKIKFLTSKLHSSSNIINKNNLNNYDDDVRIYLDKIKKKFPARLQNNITNKFPEQKILHLGELIIDKYVFTQSVGMSGKEAISIIKPLKEINFLGGSGYIVNLLSGFSKKISLLSFIGKNLSNKNFILKNLSKLAKKKLVDKNNTSVVKKRYIDEYSNKRIIGVYNADEKPILKKEENAYIKKLHQNSKNKDAIVISDFGHEEFTPKIISTLKKYTHKIYLNCQINAFSRNYYSIFKYKKVNTIIVNESELRHELRDKYTRVEDLIKNCKKLFKFKVIIITRGKKGGICYVNNSNKFYYYPALNKNPVDTIGAGDSFFSICSLSLSCGASPELACFFGNIAAYHSVSSMGNKKPLNFVSFKKLISHVLK